MKKLNTILVILVILVAFNTLTNITQLVRQPVAPLGGSTAGDWGVGGDLTVTGTQTYTGAAEFNANLVADGGFIKSGRIAIGETASFSMTAAQICDYNLATIEPFEYGGDDFSGASISLPNDEAMTADCLSAIGDETSIIIDNTASTTTAFLDFVETGYLIGYASAQRTDWAGDRLILVRGVNVDGSSISWEIDTIEASISFQAP